MKLTRRLLQIVFFIATLLVGSVALVVIVSQTAWFKNWVRGVIERQADQYLNGDLTIDRLAGNFFFGLELEGIRVALGNEPVIQVKDIGLDYSIFQLLSTGLVIDDIRINEPVIRLRRTADGWNLGRLVKERAREADREGPREPISIGEIGISAGRIEITGAEGSVVGTSGVDTPTRVERLDGRFKFSYEPVHYTVEIAHLSFRTESPRFGLNSLSGKIATRDDTLFFEKVAIRTEESSVTVDGFVQNYLERPVAEVVVESDKLTLEEIARLVPALRGIHLQPAFKVTANGPMDRLRIDANVKSSAGDVDAAVIADVMAPGRTVTGDVALRHVDLAPVLRGRARRTDITGTARLDLRINPTTGDPPLAGVSGRVRFQGPRVSAFGYEARQVRANVALSGGRALGIDARGLAYGGRADARGTIELPARRGDAVAYDLRGDAGGVDLRNLPRRLQLPQAPSQLNVTYHVKGRGSAVDGDLLFRQSTFAGATIGAGTTAEFSRRASTFAYAARGHVATLNLQALGRALRVTALSADRYESRITGEFAVRGAGTRLESMTLDASGTLVDSTVFGASVPRLTFESTIARGDLAVKANGEFAGLDPALALGRPKLAGRVSGAVDGSLAIRGIGQPLTPDSIEADGTVTLGSSTIGGLAVDRAVVDGTYQNRTGDIRRLTVTGPDVNAEASGHLALDEQGASNVTYKIDTSELERIGELVGRPLRGAAKLDGKLTGNGRELKTAGTVAASNVAYGETEALSLNGTYDVAVPSLDAKRIRLTADTTATFVEVKGRSITELAARVSYSGQQLDFEASAQEGVRALDAAGSLILHPDHQEVHLKSGSFRAERVQWSTAPGVEATIKYGGDRIVIQGLSLVSGDQRIDAEGAVGQTGSALKVTATNVDLAALDALALGDQRLAGRLDAEATITGAVKAPEVAGRFAVRGGAFRQFKYDSFGGTLEYRDTGLLIDARLEQAPGHWLTAKGFVPAAVFKTTLFTARGAPPPRAVARLAPLARHTSTTGGRASEGHEEAAAGEALDLRLESSEIDLGIVQGFTSYVADVKGKLQANVRVTGSSRDPHLEGYVEIKDGTFAVPDAKTSYTGLTTRVTLERDLVRITGFRLVDQHGHVMTIAGTLATHERRVGAVSIDVASRGFEVIDNQFADVKVTTGLFITGEFTQPRVDGEVSFETGQFFLDRILALRRGSLYATEPLDVEPGLGPEAPSVRPEGILGALAMNLNVILPDNVIVKGKDLKVGGSPVGAGDVNVTLGGDLRVRKDPGGAFRLLGAVNTVRGTYNFQGRQFEILRNGRIRFEGLDRIDPSLDITARRVITGVEARVHIRGSAFKPELTLSSRPPLDQADILSLIVFGAPVNSLGTEQQVSLAARAGAMATGFVASSLAASLNRALEIDVFEIQTTPDNGGGGSVTLGEQFGKDLFVRFRQGFGAEPVSEFILEYQLTDFLRLQGAVAENGGGTTRSLMRRVERGGLDLIFFFSY